MASLMRHCFSILVYLSFIQASLGSSNSAGKVPLDLYYESLCPYCANFIVNELPIIFKNGIIDIVDLRLFPWGNARLTSNNSFICQHGPNECLFNTVEACAIDAWPNLDDHFPFIKCVESQIHEGKYTQWATCFKELGLDPKPVTSCYNGAYGKQHGPRECFLNTVEACAIDAWPNLDDHFPFINCVETRVYEGKYSQWDTCFKELSLDPKPVTSCYKGEEGKKLELKYAALTAALNPPHEYVPWVVVDGEPLLEDYENFISYICKAYKGPSPSACKKASLASALRMKTYHAHPVCYTEQTAKVSFLLKIWSFLTSWTD